MAELEENKRDSWKGYLGVTKEFVEAATTFEDVILVLDTWALKQKMKEVWARGNFLHARYKAGLCSEEERKEWRDIFPEYELATIIRWTLFQFSERY